MKIFLEHIKADAFGRKNIDLGDPQGSYQNRNNNFFIT